MKDRSDHTFKQRMRPRTFETDRMHLAQRSHLFFSASVIPVAGGKCWAASLIAERAWWRNLPRPNIFITFLTRSSISVLSNTEQNAWLKNDQSGIGQLLLKFRSYQSGYNCLLTVQFTDCRRI